MKVIILAAGRGQRYRDAGFAIPKPLITFHGKTLIAHAMDHFSMVEKNSLIVVGTPEVLSCVGERATGVRVDHTQRGPALSAVLAGGLLSDDEPVALIDSDVLFKNNAVRNFAGYVAAGRADASVLTTALTGDTSAYCNLTLVDNAITACREKTGDSSFIAVGAYGFKRWGSFRDHAFKAAARGAEVYISAVVQSFVADGAVVHGVPMQATDWTCLGTPQELESATKELSHD